MQGKHALAVLAGCVLLASNVALATAPHITLLRLQQPAYAGKDGAQYRFSVRDIHDARRLASMGDLNAQYNLGIMYVSREQHKYAFRWFHKAALRGHAGAEYNLGVLYYNGTGVERDYENAAHWFRRSAESGHPDAMFQLGRLYYQGLGVNKDPREEAAWYLKAATRGHPLAQYNLGVLYHLGEGVTKDDIQAFAWFSVAHSRGFDATEALKVTEALIAPDERQKAERLARELVERFGPPRRE